MESFQLCAFVMLSYLLCIGVRAYNDFNKACVMAHNKLRNLHGSQPLVWSKELSDEAQKWCEELAKNNEIQHDSHAMNAKNEGENLASVSNIYLRREGSNLCNTVVEKWYSEGEDYNYETGLPKAPGMPVNHFEQVVWNSTFAMGVGSARSKSDGNIICARYSPRGAVGGPDSFKRNVLPKTGVSPGSELIQPIENTSVGKEGSGNNDDTAELGKVINLRKTNLLGDFQQNEASLFEPLPPMCFKRINMHSSGSSFEYYANTKAFYSKMGIATNLDASLQSAFNLGATLSGLIQTASSKQSNVSGMSLNVRAFTEKVIVAKDCLIDDQKSKLLERFVRDFEQLPLTINNPWRMNSWKAYNVFLNKYGSHVITSAIRGASIRQTSFAESSKSYSQRDFQVKSCMSLAGPTAVAKMGVKACANVSNSEISSVTNMNTVDKLIIRGGTRETRNALTKQRTEELIEKFLNEAGETEVSVEHTFSSVWNVLLSRFDFGSDNYIRAVNLQNYYLGYLNYGCPYKMSGEVEIQKFDYSRGSSPQSPEFECTLAPEGCHNHDDCHYKFGIKCACYGKTCIRYQRVDQETGISKEIAYANEKDDFIWQGCDWKLAGTICNCYNDNIGLRKQTWAAPSRDAARKGAIHDHFGESEDTSQGWETEHGLNYSENQGV